MIKRSLLASVFAGVVVFAMSAEPAGAQGGEQGNFDVTIGGGVFLPPNASALKSASPILNMSARYSVSENFGVGFLIDYSRTETDGDVFPLAQFRFTTADSTIFVALRQPVAVFHYGLIGTLGTRLGNGSLYPYVIGGIGGYTIYQDVQATEGPNRSSGLMLNIGAALKLGITESSGIELMVRDVIYRDYDRDELNPTPDRTCRLSGDRQFSGTTCPNERFPFLDPQFSDPNFSEAKSTLHNFVVAASFSFVPGF